MMNSIVSFFRFDRSARSASVHIASPRSSGVRVHASILVRLQRMSRRTRQLALPGLTASRDEAGPQIKAGQRYRPALVVTSR